MRRLFVIIILFTSTAFISSAQSKSNLEFDEFIVDKGNFPVDQALQVFDFTFTNTGTEDLLILGSRLGCTCMSIKYPKKAIKPGKRASIRVIYNATNQHLGHFKKYAILQTNSDQHQGLWQVFCEGTMLSTDEYLDLPEQCDEIDQIETIL